MTLFTKIFGDPNIKEIKKILPLVEQINAFEPSFQASSDDEIKQKTVSLKERLAEGASLDDVMPEAFAAVREVSRRVLKQRHFDVQLMGGVALHRGMIAEMRTGEGKTLTATAPVYLNALTGKGVHLVTVNDYLARRDTVWMGQIYHALGLTVGCIQHAGGFLYDPAFQAQTAHDETRDLTGSFRVDMDYLRPVSRREAYAADITYGTNNEFGFDYLRDNMVPSAEEMVQRPLHYAVIDEVDSILIDEARTPLIISAPAEQPSTLYYQVADLVTRLIQKEDYQVDEKLRASTLTASGIAKMEQWLRVDNLYQQGGMKLVHHVEQALRAHALYKKDRDYVVRENEVVIVDEFTGRLMIGRRYSEGLHQAIEAKERVPIQRESITLATITFQNYFRLYEKIAGMTGTAVTEAEEFHKIYKLEVLSIPTHRENCRVDLPDRVYRNELGKFKAVVREIKERHMKGQPVLVGTVSIEKNELLGELLQAEGIPFHILNAKNHEREAEYIAQAGRKGAVTVATNMAGRGVDIILGGQPVDAGEAEAVRALGGLFVLGTERHESRRIDNQLRGRAARQGDPGSTQFCVSMEDDLMRIFGSQRMQGMMETLRIPEDEPIESKMLSASIEQAQKKVEGHNFDIRKHLLEYDDVLNKHRHVVYRRRRDILSAAKTPSVEGVRPLKGMVFDMIVMQIERLVGSHTDAEEPSVWEIDKIEEGLRAMLPSEIHVSGRLSVASDEANGKEDLVVRRTELVQTMTHMAEQAYRQVEESVGDEVLMAEIEKTVLLRSSDDLWIEHLESIDHLRRGIGLQGYGQRDPLVEYKKEAYRLFQEMLLVFYERVAHTIFKVKLAAAAVGTHATATPTPTTMSAPDGSSQKAPGRNDPCPCGSGKKYKKCHGA